MAFQKLHRGNQHSSGSIIHSFEALCRSRTWEPARREKNRKPVENRNLVEEQTKTAAQKEKNGSKSRLRKRQRRTRKRVDGECNLRPAEQQAALPQEQLYQGRREAHRHQI